MNAEDDRRRVLGIVPARSGSKGLPHKNVRSFHGEPLLARAVRCGLESGVIDTVLVSTDAESYAEVAREAGAAVPFLRPLALAGDEVSAIDVYLDVLERLETEHDQAWDIVVVLQPTSPLRTAEDVAGALARLDAVERARAVISVTPLEHPLEWVNTLPPDGCMADFLDLSLARANRQELPDRYRLNGAVYVSEVQELRRRRNFFGPHTYAYVMDPLHSVDIDTERDFLVAEALARIVSDKRDAPAERPQTPDSEDART